MKLGEKADECRVWEPHSITVVAVKIFWPAARKRPFRSLAEASGTAVHGCSRNFPTLIILDIAAWPVQEAVPS